MAASGKNGSGRGEEFPALAGGAGLGAWELLSNWAGSPSTSYLAPKIGHLKTQGGGGNGGGVGGESFFAAGVSCPVTGPNVYSSLIAAFCVSLER